MTMKPRIPLASRLAPARPGREDDTARFIDVTRGSRRCRTPTAAALLSRIPRDPFKLPLAMCAGCNQRTTQTDDNVFHRT